MFFLNYYNVFHVNLPAKLWLEHIFATDGKIDIAITIGQVATFN